MVCPVCGHAMEHSAVIMLISCDHCSFCVTEFEAVHLCARSPQESANLKYHYLIAQEFSPGDWRI